MIGWRLVCPSCGHGLRADARARRCRPCGVARELHADATDARPDPAAQTLLGRYRSLLPPLRAAVPLTLGEGRTPLLESASLGPLLRLERLAFKLEATNPTGSWVDRGSVAAIQHVRDVGIRHVAVLAHRGLALSVARYAARAGVAATVVAADEHAGHRGAGARHTPSLGAGAPEDRSSETAPAIRAGARLVRVRAQPTTLVAALRRAAAATGIAVVAAEDPVWAAGLRTLAFELAEPGDAPFPDLVVLASATGAEGSALTAGFRAWRPAHEPAVLAVGRGPASTPDGRLVDPRDAGTARRLLAQEEGIAASLPSAAALAAVVRLARGGQIAPEARVVVVLADERQSPPEPLDDDPQLVGRVLGGVPLADLPSVLARPAL